MELELLYKEVADDGIYYVFDRQNEETGEPETLRCSYTIASQLVKYTSYNNRNCEIVSGEIILRYEYGELLVIDTQNSGQNEGEHGKNGRLNIHFIGPHYFSVCDITSNDNFFAGIMEHKEFILSQLDLIREIDKAEIIDRDTLKVKTENGVTDIYKLSIGLKTLLNIKFLLNHYGRKATLNVNVDGCCDEIIQRIIELVAGTGIHLHVSRPIKASIPFEKYRVYVDGYTEPDWFHIVKYAYFGTPDIDIERYFEHSMSYQDAETN